MEVIGCRTQVGCCAQKALAIRAAQMLLKHLKLRIQERRPSLHSVLHASLKAKKVFDFSRSSMQLVAGTLTLRAATRTVRQSER